MRFAEFAASLFERKVLKGEVESAQTRENWELMLRLHLFPAFGEVFVDAISKSDVEAWLAGEAKKVKAGAYSPVTVNNWLRLFRGIMNEAVDELGLAKNPVIKVKGLDTSAHVTYTEEEPNALLPEEVGPFLQAVRDRHPQHLGMVALGFATGWRPSMMRPLRIDSPGPASCDAFPRRRARMPPLPRPHAHRGRRHPRGRNRAYPRTLGGRPRSSPRRDRPRITGVQEAEPTHEDLPDQPLTTMHCVGPRARRGDPDQRGVQHGHRGPCFRPAGPAGPREVTGGQLTETELWDKRPLELPTDPTYRTLSARRTT